MFNQTIDRHNGALIDALLTGQHLTPECSFKQLTSNQKRRTSFIIIINQNRHLVHTLGIYRNFRWYLFASISRLSEA